MVALDCAPGKCSCRPSILRLLLRFRMFAYSCGTLVDLTGKYPAPPRLDIYAARHLRWSDYIEQAAEAYIAAHLTRPFVGAQSTESRTHEFRGLSIPLQPLALKRLPPVCVLDFLPNPVQGSTSDRPSSATATGPAGWSTPP
eukprot:SAG22_NODE_98_length_20720_cov_17.226662_13_plen_142_part_00